MKITKSLSDNGELIAKFEMTMPNLALLTTMIGYACASAQGKGHTKALAMFSGMAKQFLAASKEITKDGKDKRGGTKVTKHS